MQQRRRRFDGDFLGECADVQAELQVDCSTDLQDDAALSLLGEAVERVDPETALEKVNLKFKRRFEFIESNAPKPLKEMNLGEMDALWNEAKKKEKDKI